MILSLDGPTTRALVEAFKVHTTDKRYWAIVTGELPGQGTIDAPLLKDAEKKLVRVAPNGEPYFVMMASYPYRVPVYIFLTLWILAMLVVLFKFLPVKRLNA
mgnify:CR=1 FL=1